MAYILPDVPERRGKVLGSVVYSLYIEEEASHGVREGVAQSHRGEEDEQCANNVTDN